MDILITHKLKTMADTKKQTPPSNGTSNAKKILTLTPKWADVVTFYMNQLETGTDAEKVRARKALSQLAVSADAFNAKLAAE